MAHNRFKSGYVPALDGMRGIAILAVMAFHTQFPLFQGGFIGVDVFFVLSGFLITTLLVREYDKSNAVSLKNFYMRRVLRLAPAFLFFLFVVVIVSFIFLERSPFYNNLIDAFIALFYVANWAHALNIHPPVILSHTWTLSIEEQFYILWPITFIFLFKSLKSRGHVALIVLSAALLSWILRVYLLSSGSTITRVYAGLDTRADTLLIGCFLGIVLSSDLLGEGVKRRLTFVLRYIAPLSALLLIRFFFKLNWMNPHIYYTNFFAVIILVGIIILDISISRESMLRVILSLKPLVWIGGISYGVYLWHYPIYSVMLSRGFSKASVLVFGTLSAFAVASVSYYCLERPFLRLKRRWASSKE